jgi:hypothetical protein
MPRRLVDTVIATFGDDVGVRTQFVPEGSGAVGRQSQAWLRTKAGWRRGCARVSGSIGRAPVTTRR